MKKHAGTKSGNAKHRRCNIRSLELRVSFAPKDCNFDIVSTLHQVYQRSNCHHKISNVYLNIQFAYCHFPFLDRCHGYDNTQSSVPYMNSVNCKDSAKRYLYETMLTL